MGKFSNVIRALLRLLGLVSRPIWPLLFKLLSPEKIFLFTFNIVVFIGFIQVNFLSIGARILAWLWYTRWIIFRIIRRLHPRKTARVVRPDYCEICQSTLENCHGGRFYDALEHPNDHFRLLRVCKDDDVEIRCELVAFSRSDTPSYTALSYRWLDEAPTCQIHIGSTPFRVRSNVLAFLQQVKIERNFGWLFIDSISVNQHDSAEKSIQVSAMGDIYTKAEDVVTWLVPPIWRKAMAFHRETILSKKPATESAVQALIECMDPKVAKDGFPPNTILEAGLNAFNQPGFLEAYVSRVDEKAMETLANLVTVILFPDDYWTRLWPLQEMLLARRLYFRCGFLNLEWNIVRMIVDTRRDGVFRGGSISTGVPPHVTLHKMLSPRSLGDQNSHAFLMMHETLWRKQKIQSEHSSNSRMSLHEAVTAFATQRSTNRSDKVFALLGMTTSKIQADYSMPLEELYIRALVEGLSELLLQGDEPDEQRDVSRAYATILNFCWSLLIALDLDHMDTAISTITFQVMMLFKPPEWTFDDYCWTDMFSDGKALANLHKSYDEDLYPIIRLFTGSFFWNKLLTDLVRVTQTGRGPLERRLMGFLHILPGSVRSVLSLIHFCVRLSLVRLSMAACSVTDTGMPLPGDVEQNRSYSEWTTVISNIFTEMQDNGTVPEHIRWASASHIGHYA